VEADQAVLASPLPWVNRGFHQGIY